MNPLERGRRKLTEAIALTGMRPPLSVAGRTRITLRGKRVLVTGASSGIGEAGAEAFAAEGAEVIVVARRADLLDEVAARIADRGGIATALACDLSELDAVDALANAQHLLVRLDVNIGSPHLHRILEQRAQQLGHRRLPLVTRPQIAGAQLEAGVLILLV